MEPLTPQADPVAQYHHALSLHQAGRLHEAAAAYQTLVARNPQDYLSLAGLGKIAAALGNYEGAVQLFRQSLGIFPSQPECLTNLGAALISQHRLDEALTVLDRAIALKPDLVQAHNNRGTALLELDRPAAALESFDHALSLRPDLAVIHANRGIALQNLKRPNEALAAYDHAVALKQDYAEAYNDRGNVLRELKRPDEALSSYDRAIALRPDVAEAYNNRGNLLGDLRRLPEAFESFERAIALKPDYAEAFSNRGIALKDMNRLDEALASLDHAVLLKPDYAEGYSNRGVVRYKLGQLDQALADYDRAIALNPDYPEACNNRGNVLNELSRFHEAVESLGRAIALNPAYAEAYSNRGNAFGNLRQLDQALADYDRAIALNPDYPEAYWNKSLLKLLLGEYEEGWKLYEWRWKTSEKNFLRDFSRPLWLGDPPIAGKTLLIHAEQGFGDFIQCCRYASLAEARGARVVLEVPAALRALVSTLRGNFTIVARGDVLPPFDFHCPVMSLPLAFRTTVRTIPASVPYLFADPARLRVWRQRLGTRDRMRVGLAWSGNPVHKNDLNRSIPASLLAPLLALPVEFHVLQKGIRPEDASAIAGFGNVHVHEQEIGDFSDTAALAQEMDLVVSVDTSVAHVAGAMGRPLWLLLPFNQDYRWLLDRSDSPWYPSATLFRQPASGDWPSVIARVGQQLRALTEG